MSAPIAEKRLGSVKIAVWENPGTDGKYYNFTIKKSYQKDGEWHDTELLSERDLRDLLPLIANVVNAQVKQRKIEKKSQEQIVKEVFQGDAFEDDIPF